MNEKENLHIETKLIRNQIERTSHQEHSVPLYLTSSYVFDSAEHMRAAFQEEVEHSIYSRYSNPNSSEFIAKVAQMEGAEDGFAFASGMAAVFNTLATFLNAGDHLISARSIFGSTHSLFQNYFPKWNIEHSYFDVKNLEQIEGLIKENTKLIYAETPTNPGVDLIDLELLGQIAKKHNILLIIDNCFATPYLQQPIKYGADLVIHSATKLMDGQGRVLGGITVGSSELIRELYLFSRNTGPAISPFNAWILSKSLETLAIRVEKQCENALKLAERLSAHQAIEFVKYPFLKSHPQYDIAKKQMKLGGTIIAFELKGGLSSGKRFIDAIQLCSRSANLGDTRTIVTHPASTTHAKLSEEQQKAVGITPGLIRISVGLEHIDDIAKDLTRALDA